MNDEPYFKSLEDKNYIKYWSTNPIKKLLF